MKENIKVSIPFLFVLLFVSMSPSAWDGAISGKIDDIHITGGGNYDLRVLLEGRPKLCGNTMDWAYINESDANYQSYLSVILSAKMSDRIVTLHTTREQTSGNGYCKIGYLIVD